MDKMYPTEDEYIINKWKQRLIKGNFLENWVISNIEINREFPKEQYSSPPKKSPFNIDFSFMLLKQNFPTEMSKFLTYLNDNYN